MEAVAETTTTTTPAPETSSPAPSTASAPVTSTTQTTASTPVAVERLTDAKSISKFLRDRDTADAAKIDPTQAAQPGAATTAQAPAPEKVGEVTSTTPKVEPPKEAWPTILENARTKSANEIRAQYGNLPPEKLREFAGIAQQMTADPIGFLNTFAAQLANHPTYGPQLRSTAGRTLAAAPAARPEPDVQVLNDKGQVVGMTYSAERQQAVNEWDWTQREEKLNQRLQPLISAHEQHQQEVQVAAFQKEVATGAESELTRVNEILEGRKELGPKVAELMAQGVNHIDAALQVRKQFIAPNAAKAAEAAVLDTQLKKVAGNTANGSGPTALKAKIGPQSSQKDLANYLRELDQASA